MNGRYAVLAARIRQDVTDLERVVDRVEWTVAARRQHSAEQDAELFLDATALNLHDFYSGLERIFTHIAAGVDQSVPTGADWHRELLRQMTIELPGLRPPILTAKVAAEIDEFLRFRHVVRHVYAFELEPDRVERLADRVRPVFRDVTAALVSFATILEELRHRE